MKKLLLLLAILTVSLLSVLPVSAATSITLSPGEDIQAAINNIDNGGIIFLQGGTYHANLIIDAPNKSFSIVSVDESNPGIIDGSGSGSVISITNTGTHTITLEGLIITNGDAEKGGGIHAKDAALHLAYCVLMENNATNGGGMYCETAEVTIVQCYIAKNTANYGAGVLTDHCTACTITDSNILMNTATMFGGGMYNYHTDAISMACIYMYNMAGNGGGMYNSHSDATVTDCGFTLNGASMYGGGMANTNDSNATITNCVFDSNSAEYGGGMENTGSQPNIGGCTFVDNWAYYGAGMRNYYNAHAAITDCTFRANSAFKNGGGMINEDYSAPLITSCTFVRNIAYELGGGMCNVSGAGPQVESCIFDRNGAKVSGGGIYTRDAENTAVNCIFLDNFSAQGGALFNYNSNSTIPRTITITITNCTFYGNKMIIDPEDSSVGVGNAMYNAWIDTVITNCILWDGGESEILSFSCSPAVTYCDVQGGYEGKGNIDSDPLFANAGAENFALIFGSPCINTGTDARAASYGSVSKDITGLLRPQGGGFDMGAYEFRQTYSPASMQPLARTQLQSVLITWDELSAKVPAEPPEEMVTLIGQIQAHMANAMTLSNAIYVSGQLHQALALMGELSALL